jgi:hypothetical protein
MNDLFDYICLFDGGEDKVEDSDKFLVKLSNALTRTKNLLDLETGKVIVVNFGFSFLPSKNEGKVILKTSCSLDKRKTIAQEYYIESMVKILDSARVSGININEEETLQAITSNAMKELELKYFKDKYVSLYSCMLRSNAVVYKNDVPIFTVSQMEKQPETFISISAYSLPFQTSFVDKGYPMLYLDFKVAKEEINKTLFSNLPDPCSEFVKNYDTANYKLVFFDKERDLTILISAKCNDSYNLVPEDIKIVPDYNNLKNIVFNNYNDVQTIFNLVVDKNMDADLMDMINDIF